MDYYILSGYDFTQSEPRTKKPVGVSVPVGGPWTKTQSHSVTVKQTGMQTDLWSKKREIFEARARGGGGLFAIVDGGVAIVDVEYMMIIMYWALHYQCCSTRERDSDKSAAVYRGFRNGSAKRTVSVHLHAALVRYGGPRTRRGS